MKKYLYLGIAVVVAILFSSCDYVDKSVTLNGKVAYIIAYIDTVHNETTFVETPAVGARLYLVGDPSTDYPYTGPVLETTTNSTGDYSFVVYPTTGYEGFPPVSNIGVKIQAFYFDNVLGPGYGEITGYTLTPGKDANLPTIYLKRQTD
jgi:hypothetical protein